MELETGRNSFNHDVGRNKMICCNMGKQKIARANHLYLNCKSVLEFYEYVCASVGVLSV